MKVCAVILGDASVSHLPRSKDQPFSTDVKNAKYSSSRPQVIRAQVGGLNSADRKPPQDLT